ncbi:hypothetical protein B0G74_6944 [Paraburkholderia sp. BL9I2N2]|jgi:hypothetical protein|nr:hypothetical protein B0G74_6944 [Paraburkholderia sp. BL9I2N2]
MTSPSSATTHPTAKCFEMRSGYFVSGIGQSKHGCAIRLCLLRKHSATTPGERCLPISCAPSSRNPERVADEPEGSVCP